MSAWRMLCSFLPKILLTSPSICKSLQKGNVYSWIYMISMSKKERQHSARSESTHFGSCNPGSNSSSATCKLCVLVPVIYPIPASIASSLNGDDDGAYLAVPRTLRLGSDQGEGKISIRWCCYHNHHHHYYLWIGIPFREPRSRNITQ